MYHFMRWCAAAAVLLQACQPSTSHQNDSHMRYAHDSHSLSRPNEIAITHLHLELQVDFESKVLRGAAHYTMERSSGNTLALDVSNIEVHNATTPDGKALPFRIVPGNERGDLLEIDLPKGLNDLSVHYSTRPDAAALFWTPAEQTLDGTAPFLFTQGQAILTRTWIPVQDSPGVRFTYTASIQAPAGMMALMSAQNPTSVSEDGSYHFRMPKPIPAYLMALAVGNLGFVELGERTGVYAEPGMLKAAAWEFADMEAMLIAAEALYGPYAWGRYDLLVLPPSFPFGGMENPMLTFATPTIIAGDRSLTSLIAHELAHSWSGNLVTNATWNDFWLNEGFTVYFEKRIMEALYGAGYAEMLNVLGYQDLLETLADLGSQSPDTHLKLQLDGRNPDDGMNDIAYEKGYLLLRSLEEAVGRATFDAFLTNYFREHAFRSMTTEAFIAYLDANLLNALPERPDVETWIYAPGLPAGHPVPASKRFDAVDAERKRWEQNQVPAEALATAAWSTHEWLHFVRGLNPDLGTDRMRALDDAFGLTRSQNSEIAAAWYLLSIRAQYKHAYPNMEAFLLRVGRRKFIKPLYEALSTRADDKAWATAVYQKARSRYHAVSVQTIDQILGYGSGV
jgi:aminopeptidase N